MECSHVETSVALTQESIALLDPKEWVCVECKTNKSPWICLKCGSIRCGRYVNGHAKMHAEMNPGHCLCMDLNLTVFCYVDNDFVINDNNTIQFLREHIQQKLSSRCSGAKTRSSPSSDSEEDNELRDLRPPTKISKMEDADESDSSVHTAGLINLGNTCFMNAILQSLSNIQQFCSYFRQLSSVEVTVTKDHHYHTRSSANDVCLVEEIRKILCSLWDDHGTVSPDSFFSAVSKLVPRFRGYQQQDAHEFMRYLLDQLHTELCQQAPSLINGDVDGVLQDKKPRSSVVSQLFEGLLQSDVTCLECHAESQKLDPILDVSLDIPEKAKKRGESCTLTECLNSFTMLEHLSETEWYYCAHCKKRQPSSKQLSLRSLPNVLCLHLKRFRFHSFLRSKLSQHVVFPTTGLDMAPYTSLFQSRGSSKEKSRRSTVLYDLVAVVVHHGSGVGSGHYTAYARNHKAKSWYHFNDGTVTETDVSWVAKSKAYILFYTRRDWQHEGMPKQPHPQAKD